MGAYTSYDDLIAKCTQDGQVLSIPFAKHSIATVTAGNMYSTWYQQGYPAAGSNPATTPGTAYDNADGSIWLPDDGSHTKYLLSAEILSAAQGVFILYDRLVGVSGIPLNSTGNKTVNSTTLPRYTDGLGNEVWLEINTLGSGGSAPVVTLNSYTDEDDNTGQSGPASTFLSTTNLVGTLHKLPLNADDRGVKSVETINVGTAGSSLQANVLIVHPLLYIAHNLATGGVLDTIRELGGMIKIEDGACLCVAYGPNIEIAQNIRFGLINIGWV